MLTNCLYNQEGKGWTLSDVQGVWPGCGGERGPAEASAPLCSRPLGPPISHGVSSNPRRVMSGPFPDREKVLPQHEHAQDEPCGDFCALPHQNRQDTNMLLL